jgi:hypothetical protein
MNETTTATKAPAKELTAKNAFISQRCKPRISFSCPSLGCGILRSLVGGFLGLWALSEAGLNHRLPTPRHYSGLTRWR